MQSKETRTPDFHLVIGRTEIQGIIRYIQLSVVFAYRFLHSFISIPAILRYLSLFIMISPNLLKASLFTSTPLALSTPCLKETVL